MSLPKALASVASKLTRRFGAEVVIRYKQPGLYNVTTGKVSNNHTDVIVDGVLGLVDLQNVNDLIRVGDKRLTVSAEKLPTAPTTKDVVVIDGVVHQIAQVDTTEPSQEPIVYEMIVRA